MQREHRDAHVVNLGDLVKNGGEKRDATGIVEGRTTSETSTGNSRNGDVKAAVAGGGGGQCCLIA